jgi:hypothetical protein
MQRVINTEAKIGASNISPAKPSAPSHPSHWCGGWVFHSKNLLLLTGQNGHPKSISSTSGPANKTCVTKVLVHCHNLAALVLAHTLHPAHITLTNMSHLRSVFCFLNLFPTLSLANIMGVKGDAANKLAQEFDNPL